MFDHDQTHKNVNCRGSLRMRAYHVVIFAGYRVIILGIMIYVLRSNVRTSLFYSRRKLSTIDGSRKGCANERNERDRDANMARHKQRKKSISQRWRYSNTRVS